MFPCVCVCVSACAYVAVLLRYATRLHVVICCLWIHRIFRHYFINGAILGKKLLNFSFCVLNFCTTLFEKFLIVKRIQRDIVINVYTFSCKVLVILVGF